MDERKEKKYFSCLLSSRFYLIKCVFNANNHERRTAALLSNTFNDGVKDIHRDARVALIDYK